MSSCFDCKQSVSPLFLRWLFDKAIDSFTTHEICEKCLERRKGRQAAEGGGNAKI